MDEAFAPDYLEHNPRPGQEPGVDGYNGGALMLRAAFPDLSLDVHDIIAEGDRVAVLYTLHGTHDGELMGLPVSVTMALLLVVMVTAASIQDRDGGLQVLKRLH